MVGSDIPSQHNSLTQEKRGNGSQRTAERQITQRAGNTEGKGGALGQGVGMAMGITRVGEGGPEEHKEGG